jgi:hypothetical protein
MAKTAAVQEALPTDVAEIMELLDERLDAIRDEAVTARDAAQSVLTHIADLRSTMQKIRIEARSAELKRLQELQQAKP